MKHVLINADGDLICPSCGAKSFSSKRSRGAKLALGLTVGVGALAAPKRLRCLGCKTSLKGPPIPQSSPAAALDRLASDETEGGDEDDEVLVDVLIEMPTPVRGLGLQLKSAGLRAKGGFDRQDIDEMKAALDTHGQARVEELPLAVGEAFARALRKVHLTATVEPIELHDEEQDEDVGNGEPAFDLVDQLTRLAGLRDQGILTDEEFAAQKAKLLA